MPPTAQAVANIRQLWWQHPSEPTEQNAMLQQVRQLTVPNAISIAFFDATFLAIANLLDFSQHDVMLGLSAGAASGMCVLAAVIWQGLCKPAQLLPSEA
jgi:hypothetical protein